MKKHFLILGLLFCSVSVTSVNSQVSFQKGENRIFSLIEENEKEINIDNNNIVFRRWWQTLFVDLAGALGGAAAGHQLCGGHPWCIAGGVLIGGVGASVARPSNINNNSDQDVIVNHNNNYDSIGLLHNQIAKEYFRQTNEFNRNTFTNFLEERLALYNIPMQAYMRDNLSDQIDRAISIDVENLTTDQAVDYLVRSLPDFVTLDRSKFRKDILFLLNSRDLTDFNSKVLVVENNFLQSRLNENEYIVISSFFSILRYSAALWN